MVPQPGAPLRLLFLGRIMPYKGLSLFVDMVECLRRDGFAVEAGVAGEGALGSEAGRLAALRAEVINRWLSEDEIGALLSRYHAVVLSHTEASQSGVAAAAFGSGLPVIATPVGGLIEQVDDGRTGVLAEGVDGKSLARAAKRLVLDPALYSQLQANIAKSRQARSMAAFVEGCAAYAVAGLG
jgi:glycosyltransferase involved in cell wall biosynthesis